MPQDRNQMRFNVFVGSIILHTVLGTCDRLRTACGIIKDKRLRGIGFNGSVSGGPHCDDVGHLMIDGHCERTLHGEENAIFNTDREHLMGGEVIVMATPCIRCMKSLIHSGVSKINYIGSYQNAKGREEIEQLASQQGVMLQQLDLDFEELFQDLFDQMAEKGGVLNRAGYRLAVSKKPLE